MVDLRPVCNRQTQVANSPQVTLSPEAASESLRQTLAKTMVLEMSQGKETTAAGYASYAALEEKYALGMGMVLGGGQLRLPRHSAARLVPVAAEAPRGRHPATNTTASHGIARGPSGEAFTSWLANLRRASCAVSGPSVKLL